MKFGFILCVHCSGRILSDFGLLVRESGLQLRPPMTGQRPMPANPPTIFFLPAAPIGIKTVKKLMKSKEKVLRTILQYARHAQSEGYLLLVLFH